MIITRESGVVNIKELDDSFEIATAQLQKAVMLVQGEFTSQNATSVTEFMHKFTNFKNTIRNRAVKSNKLAASQP